MDPVYGTVTATEPLQSSYQNSQPALTFLTLITLILTLLALILTIHNDIALAALNSTQSPGGCAQQQHLRALQVPHAKCIVLA